MTPGEWERCADPAPLLELLRGKAGDRALRRFACACVRRVWPLLAEESSRAAVVVAERYADGLAGADELSTACGAASRTALDVESRPRAGAAAPFAELCAAYAARGAASSFRWGDILPDYPDAWAADAAAWAAVGRTGAAGPRAWAAARTGERAAQAALLRCLLGNPFGPPVPLDAAVLAWHGGAAVKLARAVHDDRDLRTGTLDAARLAVLADMLEEAGCADGVLLGHLRSPAPHVRGCWTVNLVLGSSRRQGERL
jgi:hypothetical protein